MSLGFKRLRRQSTGLQRRRPFCVSYYVTVGLHVSAQRYLPPLTYSYIFHPVYSPPPVRTFWRLEGWLAGWEALNTQRPVPVASTSHFGFGIVAHNYVSVCVTVVFGNVVTWFGASLGSVQHCQFTGIYEGWNFNSGNYIQLYLQLIQNRYMFRSFTVLQCCHQHCVQPVASDVEVVGYL